MRNTKEQFQELLALTALHVTQEFSTQSWFNVDQDSYAYFKEFATHNKPKKTVLKHPDVALPVGGFCPDPPKAKPQENAAAVSVPLQNSIPIQPEPKKNIPEQIPGIKIEGFSISSDTDFTDMRKIIFGKFSNIQVIDSIPTDELAKRMKSIWKNELEEQVLILSLPENANNSELLHNIAKALKKASVVSKVIMLDTFDEQFENLFKGTLKLILISPDALSHSPKLKNAITTENNHHFISKIPVIMLDDLSLYLRDPQTKVALWAKLKALLKF